MLDGSFDARVAHSAREALEMAEDIRPRIVFLDIVLPDGEGYDVCSRLKRAFVNQPMQIVLMSANYEANRMERILATGADDFIKKPFEPLEFQLRLKAAQIRLRAGREPYDKAARPSAGPQGNVSRS
jgi:DNA-binding response OmpR family regulator